MPFFFLIARFVHSLFRSQRQLVFENLALRQQVVMLRQSVKKPRPSVADKLFWIIFSQYVEAGGKYCSACIRILLYAGIGRASAFIGVGRVETGNRDGQLLMQPYAN